MTGDVSYELVRTQVHEAIWRLRGADETRILVEAERLRQLAEQVRDPAGRAHALAQVTAFRPRVAPPQVDRGRWADQDTCLVEPPRPPE